MISNLAASPFWLRASPFLIFAALTACQGMMGEASRYWIYLLKTAIGAWMIWAIRPLIAEMRWVFSWAAVGTGVAVFLIWVGLDEFYPKWGPAGEPWNPNAAFGENSAPAWSFIAVRIIGSSLIVPPLEEVFYRSLVYRWIAKPDFLNVPLGRFNWMPFLVTSLIFGLAHREWLAGILCGFAYQGLVCWKNRLGDAMTAHAITNLLLGIWVVWKGAWQFW